MTSGQGGAHFCLRIADGYPVRSAVAVATSALQMHGVRDDKVIEPAHAKQVDRATLLVVPVRLLPSGPATLASRRGSSAVDLVADQGSGGRAAVQLQRPPGVVVSVIVTYTYRLQFKA